MNVAWTDVAECNNLQTQFIATIKSLGADVGLK